MVNIQENDLALVTGGISETGAKVLGGVVGFILGGIVGIPVWMITSIVFRSIAGKEYRKSTDELDNLNKNQQEYTKKRTWSNNEMEIIALDQNIDIIKSQITDFENSETYKKIHSKMVAQTVLQYTAAGTCVIGFTVAGVNIAKHLWKKSQKSKIKN